MVDTTARLVRLSKRANDARKLMMLLRMLDTKPSFLLLHALLSFGREVLENVPLMIKKLLANQEHEVCDLLEWYRDRAVAAAREDEVEFLKRRRKEELAIFGTKKTRSKKLGGDMKRL